MSLIRFGSSVPRFVKILREDMRWSQGDLAKQLGVHPQYVSNVERGVNKNPVAFCSLLFAICPRDRRDYLVDLISDSGQMRVVERVRGKSGKNVGVLRRSRGRS